MDSLRDTLAENRAFLRDQELKVAARLAILPKGRIREKRIGSGVYYYLSHRSGRTVRTDYLGRSVPSGLRAELEERARLKTELHRVRSGLKLLRAGVSRDIDIIDPLRAVFRVMTEERMWEAGVEIIGSWCFLLYQKTLPVEAFPFKTDDLDVLVPRPPHGNDFDFGEALTRLGFGLRFHPDGSEYYVGMGMKIEFLTREGRASRSNRVARHFGVVSQPLRYLEILIKAPVVLKIAPGIRVKVPAPGAFLVHKLIVSTLPGRVRKKEKDIRQAIHTAAYVLRDADGMKLLMKMRADLPKSWRARIGRALKDALEIVPQQEGVIRRLQELLLES